jgi:hypothetical protein
MHECQPVLVHITHILQRSAQLANYPQPNLAQLRRGFKEELPINKHNRQKIQRGNTPFNSIESDFAFGGDRRPEDGSATCKGNALTGRGPGESRGEVVLSRERESAV